MVIKHWSITPEDVYGKDLSGKAPEGYEFTGEFRPPKVGEEYLHPSCTEAIKASVTYGGGSPYLILRKILREPTTEEILDYVLRWISGNVSGSLVVQKNTIGEGRTLVDSIDATTFVHNKRGEVVKKMKRLAEANGGSYEGI